MRTLAIFKGTNNTTLKIKVEGNAVIYIFKNDIYRSYEVAETSFSEETLVALLSEIDETVDEYDIMIEKFKLSKYRNKESKIRYRIGSRSYTFMKLLP